MAVAKRSKPNNFQTRKILWVAPLVLDTHLHGTSLLEILRNLAKRGYNTNLVAVRSQKAFQTENPPLRIIAIPLRHVPIVSPLMFTFALFLFLPIHVIKSRPDFITFNRPFSKELLGDLLNDLMASSIEDYARCLYSLCTSENLRRELGERLRTRALENFDIKIVADEYLKLYRNLMS